MIESVSVIGLGNMGARLAGALLDGGYDVTVWNRSPAKAEPLAAAGAAVAVHPHDALRASSLTIICVTRYEHIYDALGDVLDELLADRCLVNLTWGTPDDARRLERWVRVRGGRYLDGAIPVYPSGIAQPETGLLYAGPPALWKAYEGVLLELGGASRLVGEEIGAANVLAIATAGNFYHLCYGAFFEAAAYAVSEGVPIAELQAQIDAQLAVVASSIADAARAIQAGSFTTDQATLDIHLDAVRIGQVAMHDQGQRGTLLEALVDVFNRGVHAGHGQESAAAITPLLSCGG